MKLWQPTFSTALVVMLSACASSAGGPGTSPAPAGAEASMPGTTRGSDSGGPVGAESGGAVGAGSDGAVGAVSDRPVVAESTGSGATTFSAAQADRGRDTFRAACTECHYSSEFSDSQFKFKWSRRSAGNLYRLIITSMPETEPGILSPEESVELVSYILRMNGFEPGAGDLAAERAVLDAISLASIRNE
jgi:Cytochrome C oxidase, cbb3-type, subunit III